MKKNKKSEWLDWIKALLIAVVLAFTFRALFFSPVIVDGPSMLPTLEHRDQIFVNKFIYKFKDIERFDIVVFHATTEKDFIKRVIGLPGEHVMVKDDILYINNVAIREPFIEQDKQKLTSKKLTKDFTLEALPGGYETIPDGYVLVLGDNRNNSTDSRRLGLISIDQIVGKANLIYWPLNRIKVLKGA